MEITLKCTYVGMASPGRGKPKEQVTTRPEKVIDLPTKEAENLISRGLAAAVEPEPAEPDDPDA